MTVNSVAYGDNPFVPGMISQDTYTSDQLIAGDFPLETQPIMIALPSGGPTVLARGTVLGRNSAQSILVTPGATNTGNGTVGSTARGAGALTGAYALAATSSTTFTVTDPEGNALPNATVGTAYSQSGIGFTITAGGTAFVAGDTFAVTTEDATGLYYPCVSTASDGSQTPVAILVDQVTASTTPVLGGAYLTGEFNQRRITYDPSWTLENLRAALRPYSIFLKSSVSGTPPY